MKKRGVIYLIILGIILIIFNAILLNAASLPTVGGDSDTWGTILNEYLRVQHNASGQHTNITSYDITTKSPVTDVRAFGALGDGATDDTAEIQAAIDFVEAQGGGTLFFPRGTYMITSTITWKNGVRLEGEQSGFFVPGRYPELKWGGAADGTMFVAEEINEDWEMTDAIRLTFRGSGTNNPGIFIDFRDRVGYGTTFWKCQFANSNGDALIFRKGASNFYMYDFRADGIGGYLIYANGSYGGKDSYQLDKFTYDTGAVADVADGMIFVEGSDAPIDNSSIRISVSNTRLELNANLSGDNNSVILLGVNPSISDYVQYYITLNNVLLAGATGTENFSLVRSTPASDQFTVVGTNVVVSSGEDIISNSITPAPIKDRIHPFFVFAPFVSGSPESSNELISFIGRLYMSENFGVGTLNPTAKMFVNGSLRVQNTSGTLALYVNESTGYVGIGTTNPTGILEIVSSDSADIYLNRTGAKNWRIASDSAGSFLIQLVSPIFTALRIDSSGKFGFGLNETSPDTQIDVGVFGSGIYDILRLRNTYLSANNQGTRIIFSSRTANTSFANVAGIAGVMTDNNNTLYKGDLIFYTANGTTLSEKMRIDSNGTLILAPNRTAIACSAITEGGVMYSNSTKKHYGCNGTDWIAFY